MLNKIKARWASQSVDARFEFIRFVLVILLSLALTLGIVLLVSNEPLYALQQFFFGPVSRFRKMANVIEAAIPLTFLGLSVSVMFSARQFNLGSSGSLFLGGTVASVIALTVPLPAVIHPLFAVAIAGIVGGIWTSIPALIKLKYGASELVSSLMLNFVALNLGFYIILNYFRDPQAGSLASFLFPQSAILPTMVPDTRIHYGLIILIGVIIATYYFMVKTKWGYALRMTGFNKKFATYSGISTTAVILYSQFIGGMLAGFGGAVEKLGMHPRFLWQFMPAYAFDGIIVAVLAKDRPQYIPVAAFVLAYIRIGADTMSTNSDVSFQMIAIIQGLIIILIAANAFLSKTRQKMVVKEATND